MDVLACCCPLRRRLRQNDALCSLKRKQMAIGVQDGMSTLLQVIEIAGILAFAFSGFIEARSKDMDFVGVFTVAFITAFGGGTLRDLLLDRRPLFWVEHQEYSLLVFALALVVSPFLRHLRTAFSEKLIVIADAFGLGLFSALGASLAQEAGMPLFVAAMMGVITGIFGGVLRDVLCNEIPLVFRRGHLYATCSFAGCWVYLVLDRFDTPEAGSLFASIVITVAMRLAAVRFNLRLPG
jgi:uncharacterized membrane protein YeiH